MDDLLEKQVLKFIGVHSTMAEEAYIEAEELRDESFGADPEAIGQSAYNDGIVSVLKDLKNFVANSPRDRAQYLKEATES